MSANDVLALADKDEDIAALLPLIKPFFGALEKCDQATREWFLEQASKKNWAVVDERMFPLMTDAERNELSIIILTEARKTTAIIAFTEQVLKIILINILSILIQKAGA